MKCLNGSDYYGYFILGFGFYVFGIGGKNWGGNYGFCDEDLRDFLCVWIQMEGWGFY